jgi:hypothetical protein
MPSKYAKRYSKWLMLFPILFSQVLFSNPSFSDELRIPVGQQAQGAVAIDMPAKGINKERVKQLFGEPLSEIPPKGTPPISTWNYQEFTVYFERDTVIHSVRKFQPKAPVNENAVPAQ